jgi:hypothetical protein
MAGADFGTEMPGGRRVLIRKRLLKFDSISGDVRVLARPMRCRFRLEEMASYGTELQWM